MFSSHNHCNVHIYPSKMGHNVVVSSINYYQSHLLLQCKAWVSGDRVKRGHELSLCCPDGVGIENPDSPQCRLLRPLLHQPSSPSRMFQGCRCCHQVGGGGPVGQWGRRLACPTDLGKMILIDPYFSSLTLLLSFSIYIPSPKMFEVSNKIKQNDIRNKKINRFYTAVMFC